MAVSPGVAPTGRTVCWFLDDVTVVGAMISRMSRADVTGWAPCLRSELQPSESGLVMLPGTTKSSLPWLSA